MMNDMDEMEPARRKKKSRIHAAIEGNSLHGSTNPDLILETSANENH